LSSSLAVFALWLWSLQLRKLGFSLRFIICFLITAGLSEPFLSAANKFRYESLSFALTSLGILLIVHDRLLVGIFIAALAVEIEPAAMAGLIPCVVVACSINRIDRALITRLIAGMALAGGVYFALHPNIVHLGAYLPQAKPIGIVEDGGTFASYFLRRGRHLPELLFFAIAGGFYWHRRHSFESHYLGIGSLALLLFSILMPHGNPAYMIFSYPLFIAMALAAFRAEHRPWLLVGCVLLYFLPQQIYVAHLSRHLGVRSSDVAEVSQAIQTASATLQIPDPALRIYGDYRLWFAHPHFYRAAAANTLSHIQDADLYLCYDAPPQKGLLEPASLLYCPDLKARLPLRLLGTVPVRDNSLFLYAKR
jgi:hypothetical protein